MEHNQAYKNFIIQNEINDNSENLKTFQDRYKAYRLNWTNNARVITLRVDSSQINNLSVLISKQLQFVFSLPTLF